MDFFENQSFVECGRRLEEWTDEGLEKLKSGDVFSWEFAAVAILLYLFIDIFLVDFIHRKRYSPPLPPCINTLGTGLIGRFYHHIWVCFQRDDWYNRVGDVCKRGPNGVVRFQIVGKPEIVAILNPTDAQDVLKGSFEKYEKGPIFHSILGDFLGDGIFTADGSRWKHQRRAASNMFKSRLMDHAAMVIHEHSVILCDILEEVANSAKTIDLQDLYARFTLDCFFEIAFHHKLDCLRKESSFHRALDQVIHDVELRTLNPLHPWIDFWGPQIRRNLKIVDDLAYSLISERREEIQSGRNKKNGDVLSYFISEEGGYKDKDLRDAIINFILAGRDTTTQLLTWASYLISTHPEVEKNVFDSVDEVAIEGGNGSTFRQQAKDMVYLKATLDETLRLYPPVPLDYKQCVEKATLPSGYSVPEGNLVMWSAYGTGRWSELWKNPLEFQPERWLDPENPIPSQNFLAFQSGPRVCLGMNFAYMEAKLTLSAIFEKFRFVSADNFKAELLTGVTPRAKNGMWMKVVKRK